MQPARGARTASEWIFSKEPTWPSPAFFFFFSLSNQWVGNARGNYSSGRMKPQESWGIIDSVQQIRNFICTYFIYIYFHVWWRFDAGQWRISGCSTVTHCQLFISFIYPSWSYASLIPAWWQIRCRVIGCN